MEPLAPSERPQLDSNSGERPNDLHGFPLTKTMATAEILATGGNEVNYAGAEPLIETGGWWSMRFGKARWPQPAGKPNQDSSP
jgi:hypothetical protein